MLAGYRGGNAMLGSVDGMRDRFQASFTQLRTVQARGLSGEAWRSQIFTRRGGTQSSFAEIQCRKGADRVLIVNWGSFAEIMGEIRRLFNDVNALKPDEPARGGQYHGLVYNIRSSHSRLAPIQAEQ